MALPDKIQLQIVSADRSLVNESVRIIRAEYNGSMTMLWEGAILAILVRGRGWGRQQMVRLSMLLVTSAILLTLACASLLSGCATPSHLVFHQSTSVGADVAANAKAVS